MTADITPVTDAALAYGTACAADQAAIDQVTIDAGNAHVLDLTTALSALQTQYDNYVATHPDPTPPPPPPPPPAPGLMVGGTIGAIEMNHFDPDICRAYNQADALSASATSLAAVSYTPALGGPGWSKKITQATIRTWLTALPDVAGVRVCGTHEPEDQYLTASGNNVAAAASQYNTDEAAFATAVRAVSETRGHPFVLYRCFMGFSLVSGEVAARQLDLWTTGDYDEIGIDVYGPNQVALAVAFAKKHSKPLCVPEMGPADNVAHTDAAILAYMKTAVTAYKAAGVTWVSWFDKAGAGGDLSQYSKSLAYWKSLA